jgi:hypothetical protein
MFGVCRFIRWKAVRIVSRSFTVCVLSLTSYSLDLGRVRLTHASLGEVSWAPLATIWMNGYPLLAVVDTTETKRPRFAQEAAYLISLAQETFKRSDAIQSCCPTIITTRNRSIYLISMSFTRANVREFENATITKVCSSQLVMRVHHRWNLDEYDGRRSFVEDMVKFFDRQVAEVDGRAASLSCDIF